MRKCAAISKYFLLRSAGKGQCKGSSVNICIHQGFYGNSEKALSRQYKQHSLFNSSAQLQSTLQELLKRTIGFSYLLGKNS